ncbi:MAG: hypothetical protein OXC19_00590 [Bryobacterales bacterium]|nr:hypothetical protein [Bryobacterales bacterium]
MTRSLAKGAVFGAWGRVRVSACWIVSWLRALDGRVSHVEQRMARLEGVIESAGLFRPAEALEPSAGD